MLLGQVPIPTPTEVVDATGRLSETGIVGILLFFLIFAHGGAALFAWLVYRELFGGKGREGLLREFFAKHNVFLDRVAQAVEKAADSSEEASKTSKKIESTVNRLHAFVVQHNQSMSMIAKAFKYKIGVFRSMAQNIGILEEVKHNLDSMEELLDAVTKVNHDN